MIFTETPLAGAFVIDLEARRDERGLFARTFCQREFTAHGLGPLVAQGNVSASRHKGTVRGLHFQYPPALESKLVRCTRGAIFDVIVDLRPESATYLRHFTVELTADNYRSIYVPDRCAHGQQALEDNSEIIYMVGGFYAPEAEGGLSVDDPRLAIAWPLPAIHRSRKDLSWPHLDVIEPDLRARMTLPVAAGV
jgi:dTDP-4-dehydrorhamnose 3,5-epimerase